MDKKRIIALIILILTFIAVIDIPAGLVTHPAMWVYFAVPPAIFILLELGRWGADALARWLGG